MVIRSVHANLVVTILSDVTYPWECLVATLLHNLEIAHLNSRDCEVGNLKLDLDGHTTVLLALFRFDRWESELSAHQELFAAGKLLDAPNHGIGIRDVLDIADVCLENGRVDILRNGDNDFDVVGDGLRFELRLSLDKILDLGATEVFNDTVGPDQRLDVSVQTIGHQVEFTIRRDERNVTLLFELVEAHTLMELDVLHLDKFASRCPVLHLKQHLIVKT